MEKILEKILAELQSLHDGQVRMEAMQQKQGQDIAVLRNDVSEIKNELKYVWEDIKKLDSRLSAQDEELVILKRLK